MSALSKFHVFVRHMSPSSTTKARRSAYALLPGLSPLKDVEEEREGAGSRGGDASLVAPDFLELRGTWTQEAEEEVDVHREMGVAVARGGRTWTEESDEDDVSDEQRENFMSGAWRRFVCRGARACGDGGGSSSANCVLLAESWRSPKTTLASVQYF